MNHVDRKVKSKSMAFPKGGPSVHVTKPAGPGKFAMGGKTKMAGPQKAKLAKVC